MLDERVISYHEAGHCIATVHFGRPLFSVSIDADGGGETRQAAPSSFMKMVEGTPQETKLFELMITTLNPGDAERQWPKLVSLFAGRAAQRLIVGRDFDRYAAGDLEQARLLAGAVTLSVIERDELPRQAEATALTLSESCTGRRSRRWRPSCSRVGGSMPRRSQASLRPLLSVLPLGAGEPGMRLAAPSESAFGGRALAPRGW